MRDRLFKFLRFLRLSAAIVGIVSVISVIYSIFAHGGLVMQTVFTANFAVGSFITVVGLFTLIVPIDLNKLGSRLLIDHSTIGPKSMEAKEEKRKKSFELFYLGISIILIAGIIEMVLFYL